jgi:hypothetical protein
VLPRPGFFAFKPVSGKMQKDGEPVWDQVTIDRLWVTTQREAMIESGPPAAKPPPATTSAQKPGEPTAK